MPAINNNAVEPIAIEDSASEIIETINHNFSVLTQRIKELNISLSYLDVLRISTIFQVTEVDTSETPHTTDTEANLRNFVATCWNTLANYSGVYIQCPKDTSLTLFKWMDKDDVHNGDFIIKLPNNQSLYLEGAKPLCMVPTSFTTSTNAGSSYQITFTPQSTATTVTSIPLDFSNIPHTGLTAGSTSYSAGSVIPAYRDCRFYVGDEEIFFPTYFPGSTTFSIPAGAPTCTAYHIG